MSIRFTFLPLPPVKQCPNAENAKRVGIITQTQNWLTVDDTFFLIWTAVHIDVCKKKY